MRHGMRAGQSESTSPERQATGLRVPQELEVPHAGDVEPRRLALRASVVSMLLAGMLVGCGGSLGKTDAQLPGDTKMPNERSENVPNDPQAKGSKEDAPQPDGGPNPFDHDSNPGLAPPANTSWASHRNGPLKQGIAGGTLPNALVPLWKKEVKYGIPSASAIVGDHVYVPTLLGFLYCLDRRTGDEVWSYRSVPPEEKFAPGFKAPPAVTDDAVYTGDEDGIVHAIDRATGDKLWTFASGAEVSGGVTVFEGGDLLVASHGGMFRLKPADGEVVWAIREIAPIVLSPPVVDGVSFALGCEDKELGIVDVETGEVRSKHPLAAVTLSTPAVYGDRLYIGTHEGVVQELDFANGNVTWTFEPDRSLEFEGSCAVTEKAVYVGGKNRNLYRLDRVTGEEVWSFPTDGQIFSSPVVVGNRVFIASDDEHLYGVDTETGDEVFTYNLQGEVKASPVVGEGVLVVGTLGRTGAVFCFGAKSEE